MTSTATSTAIIPEALIPEVTIPEALIPEVTTNVSTERVLGILALAFGITSIAMGFHPIFAIAGLILGIISLRREPSARGFAISGIVTSAVTLGGWLFGALVAVAAIPFFVFASLWS